jgi:hypothetical protein
MTMRSARTVARLLVLAGLLLPTAADVGAASQASASLEVLRTLVYHELTAWDAGVNDGHEQAPIVSDDGETIAFARAPGSGDPANPNRIFVIGADGAGEREVDAYQTRCYCGSMIDVSADGSTVVSTEAMQLRIADGDGSSGRELLAIDSNEINALRVSGDGQTVVFRVYRDAPIHGGGTLERGLYAIDADGSDLRQVVGPAEIAPVLGIPVDQVPFFGASFGLDVSADGSRIVFGMYIEPQPGGEGQGLFAVAGDGSGLRNLLGRVSFLNNAAISGDGETVAYATADFATSYQEIGVMDFAGGEPRKLAESTPQAPGIPAALPSGERIQLSADGSRLLLGSTGLLAETDSGEVVQLGVRGGYASTDPAPVVYDSLDRATMSADARRFLYLVRDAAGIFQLAILDLDPDDPGPAPRIAEVASDAASVALAGATTATVSAEVAAGQPIVRVGVAVLQEGQVDPNTYGAILLDDGAGDDATAGDDVHTSGPIAANCCAEPGPRTLRIRVEVQDAGGLRHATAVEVAPFAVEAADESATRR